MFVIYQDTERFCRKSLKVKDTCSYLRSDKKKEKKRKKKSKIKQKKYKKAGDIYVKKEIIKIFKSYQILDSCFQRIFNRQNTTFGINAHNLELYTLRIFLIQI